MQAIQAHGCARASATATSTTSNQNCASEANGVINVFNLLPDSQQQDILNFLRSL
jgi:hypothetical protein